MSLWLSALNVRYRDVQHALPFITQIWMYASPVAYSASYIPGGPWRMVYAINPMAGVIQGFRWALVGGAPPGIEFLVSSAASLLLLAGGYLYFRRVERSFADVV